MIYIITNIFFNNGTYNIELRNDNLEKVFVKSTDQNLDLTFGDFVEVAKVSGRLSIVNKQDMPENYMDFYEKSKYSYDYLYNEFLKYYNKIQSDVYKKILDETIFKKLDFFKYPAAKSIHHAFIGGLAEHTLNMLVLSESMISMYELDRDLLWMGIILHDYSKIHELECYGLNYTVEGNLIGHLVMTVEEITRICVYLDIQEDMSIMALKHLIISHHGKLEYGAAKEPMIKEAYILSQLDEIDAKMNVLQKALLDVEENKISNAINGFDRRRFLNYKRKEK